jgi:adenosine/AMP kinase
MLEIKAVRMEFPADANIVVGQSHFIKTVEDLYEAVATTVPQAKFGWRSTKAREHV